MLVSPGILSRIPIDINGVQHFIFQLAEKNLRTKGDLFYKPIGGHMKYTEALQHRFEDFGLKRKFRYQPQMTNETSLSLYPLINFALSGKFSTRK